LSSKEVYADAPPAGRGPGRRFSRLLLLILLAICALGISAYFIIAHRSTEPTGDARRAAVADPEPPPGAASPNSWHISGALTEACTCSVPCSCNFGEGPSPHSYCYPFYSYDIRRGNFGEVPLDGLHFGSADLKAGRYIFIDERADERQRAALRIIAARVIQRVPVEESEAKAREMMPLVRYTAVEQSYDERSNHLKVEGVGEFAADYLMGMDKSEPVIVRNNTTWRIRDAIKAKTRSYRARIGSNVVETKGTNSNQGEFDYTDKMEFGGPARWNCGACANETAQTGKGQESCHKE
jgi:hypothetical protein